MDERIVRMKEKLRKKLEQIANEEELDLDTLVDYILRYYAEQYDFDDEDDDFEEDE